ncbi:MAG: ATP-binding protein [Bacteroidota bacterium]|nr:ATP-binding protein [Bacteroidota bacterium]
MSIKSSQEHSDFLFENSPISLWEEDYRPIMGLLDSVKEKNLTDYTTFLQNSPEFVQKCSQSIELVKVNAATLKLFKAPSFLFLKENLSKIYTDKSVEFFIRELNAMLLGKVEFSGETEYRRFDGKIISTIPKIFATPEKGLIITALSDITNRKKASIELQQKSVELESQTEEYFSLLEDYKKQNTNLRKAKERASINEEKFRVAFDTVSDPVAVNTISGKYVTVNKMFSVSSGYSYNEIVGKTTKEMNAWGDKMLHKEFLRLLEKTGVVKNFETKFRIKSGKLIPALISASIISIQDKQYIHSVIKDISDQKKTRTLLNERNSELKKAVQAAEESDLLKSLFLANMSHEIRTPMNAIIGFSELLIERSLPKAEQKKYLNIISRSGGHLLNLIDDIIDISKIDANQLTYNESSFDLIQFVEEIFTFFEFKAKNEDAKAVKFGFNNHLSQDKVFIRSDATRLKQILVNLLGNATKFTDTGKITLDIRLAEGKLQFSVKDTGIGIPADKLDVIFDRFQQVHSEGGSAYKGTGLGLAIAKACTQMLGGEISVDSSPGVGSEFTFTINYQLSLQKQFKPENGGNGQTSENEFLKGKEILIAEDDINSAEVLRVLLAGTGAKLFYANDGAEAVKICSNEKTIDLVLMDIQMPLMTGLEATKRIVQQSNNTVVLAQTANAMIDDERKALEAGCSDYISKPIDKKILYEKIRNLI